MLYCFGKVRCRAWNNFVQLFPLQLPCRRGFFLRFWTSCRFKPLKGEPLTPALIFLLSQLCVSCQRNSYGGHLRPPCRKHVKSSYIQSIPCCPTFSIRVFFALALHLLSFLVNKMSHLVWKNLAHKQGDICGLFFSTPFIF